MALLVFTSEEDSWLAVASYIGDLIDAGQVRPPALSMVAISNLHSLLYPCMCVFHKK
jgi:hypothetical protein